MVSVKTQCLGLNLISDNHSPFNGIVNREILTQPKLSPVLRP